MFRPRTPEFFPSRVSQRFMRLRVPERVIDPQGGRPYLLVLQPACLHAEGWIFNSNVTSYLAHAGRITLEVSISHITPDSRELSDKGFVDGFVLQSEVPEGYHAFDWSQGFLLDCEV